MTLLDITPALVATLKGQALKDAFERLAGFPPPQTKGDASLRKMVLARIVEREAAAHAEDEKPAKKARALRKVKPVVETPDYEEQAEAAEDAGHWLTAVGLWNAACDSTKVRSKQAKYAGRAAAAQVRADAVAPVVAPIDAETPAVVEVEAASVEAAETVVLVEQVEAPIPVVIVDGYVPQPVVEATIAEALESLPVDEAPVAVAPAEEAIAAGAEHAPESPPITTTPTRKHRTAKRPTAASKAPAFVHDARIAHLVGQTLSHGPHRLLVRTDGYEVTESPVVAAGTRFTSPSSAGMACNNGGKVGGYTYWHVGEPAKGAATTRQPRAPKTTPDPLTTAWTRYIATLTAGPMTPERLARAEAHTDQLIAIRSGHVVDPHAGL